MVKFSRSTKVIAIKQAILTFTFTIILMTAPVTIIPAILVLDDNYNLENPILGAGTTTNSSWRTSVGPTTIQFTRIDQGNTSSAILTGVQDSHLADNGNLEIGTLFGLMQLVVCLINPIIGLMIEQTSVFSATLFALGLDAIAIGIYAHARSYLVFMLAQTINAIACSAAGCAAYSTITIFFRENRIRRLVTGILHVAFAIGACVGPSYGGATYLYLGQKYTFFLLYIPLGLSTLLVIPVWRNYCTALEQNKVSATELEALESSKMESAFPGEAVSSTDDVFEETAETTSSLRSLLCDRFVLISLYGIGVSNFGTNSLTPTLPLWMRRTFSANEAQQGLVWMPGAVFHFIGTLAAALLYHHFPRQMHTFIILFFVACGGIYCSILYITRWYIAILLVGSSYFISGFAEYCLVPFLFMLVDRRHKSAYGRMSALIMTTLSLSNAIVTFISGPVVDAFGFEKLVIGLAVILITYCPLLVLTRKQWM